MRYIKEIVSELVQNKIDISKLVISKAITKKAAGDDDSDEEEDNKVARTKSKDMSAMDKSKKNTYKSKQAHS